MGHGLDQQVSRRELLVQQIIILILLVGITFFISTQVSAATKAAMDGKNGATGTAGIAGPAGVNGSDGQRGLVGANGVQGTAGTNGATGPAGANGLNGTGMIGATGATGANGAAGQQGIAGTNGAAGSQGAAGAQGPAGVAGTMSANFASYYSSTPVNVPSSSNWILEFPTQAASKGTDITVAGSNISISRPGTYLITASGIVQHTVYEGETGSLHFNMTLQQRVNGGAVTYVAPSPLASYASTILDSSSLSSQTFTISRLVTVTTATTDFALVLNNYSYGGSGTVYVYDHLINIVRVD